MTVYVIRYCNVAQIKSIRSAQRYEPTQFGNTFPDVICPKLKKPVGLFFVNTHFVPRGHFLSCNKQIKLYTPSVLHDWQYILCNNIIEVIVVGSMSDKGHSLILIHFTSIASIK